MKKTIYLVRHGQTNFNLKGIVQGSGIDSELNDTGHKQAYKFYKYFKNIPFDVAYVSQLKRTHQSIAPFVEKGLNQIIMPELNEINWGELEGKDPTPERYKHFLSISDRWKKGDLHAAVDGGESAHSMVERQKIGWGKIHASHFKNILICMHGRAIRSFLCVITGKHPSQMDDFKHTNLGLYKLIESEPHYDIELFNFTEHLD